MRHDYVNFGFDDADLIIAVGYELQEFDPVRINPRGDKQDHPHPPLPRRGRRALLGRRRHHRRHQRLPRRARQPRLPGHRLRAEPAPGTRALLAEEFARGQATRGTHSPRSASSPTPGPRWAATTSCSSTPVPRRCGWRGCTRPTSRNTCLISNGLSTMAFALPGALGVAAGPTRREGARGDGRRRVPDEQPGDRNRGPRDAYRWWC